MRRRQTRVKIWVAFAAAVLLIVEVGARAQETGGDVTGQVVVESKLPRTAGPHKGLATVVWLSAIDVPGGVARPQPQSGLQLVQKRKQFQPHLLVIPVGSAVEFPNRDPFFHNVFSLFNGKRFDLGLYEAGSSRTVHFDRPGISYIFCNIHSEMSAVVIALETPYFAVADPDGSLSMAHVPPGRYRLNVWHEGSSPDALASLSRSVVVPPEGLSLGSIVVPQDETALGHKNKYGREYEEPASPAYEQR